LRHERRLWALRNGESPDAIGASGSTATGIRTAPAVALRSQISGETSCLTLVWAVLDLYITHATNGIKFTQLERRRLRRMRYAGSEETTDEEVSAA
jgi:hypothetical protein